MWMRWRWMSFESKRRSAESYKESRGVPDNLPTMEAIAAECDILDTGTASLNESVAWIVALLQSETVRKA